MVAVAIRYLRAREYCQRIGDRSRNERQKAAGPREDVMRIDPAYSENEAKRLSARAIATRPGGTTRRRQGAVNPRDGDNNEAFETNERGRRADPDFAAFHIKHQFCRGPSAGRVHPTW
jgi:hypothetical protein